MNVEIVDRNGWKYAKIKQRRGAGRSVFRRLGTKSADEARTLVREAKLEEIALASQADALTREVWTRLLAGRNLKVRDTIASYESHRQAVGHRSETIRQEGLVIDRFIRGAGIVNEPVAIIDAGLLSAFINQRGPQMLSTRQHWLSIIGAWLAYLNNQRWIVTNPALDVVVRVDALSQQQLISVPHAPFAEEEVRTLLAKVARYDFWHGAILFSYHYGLRLSAVATLEESNIVANRLRVFTKKGQKTVDEPLADELWTWLQEWRTVRPPSDLPYLFVPQATLCDAGRSSHLSKQFERLLARHGIEGRSFHGLRKTATAKRWDAELAELGTREQRALTALIAAHGFRKVQEMLAHSAGSGVTVKHYFPRAAPAQPPSGSPK